MAKKSNSTPQNRTLARIARTEAYAEKVRALYAATVNRILELNKTLPNIEDGEMFSFDAQTEKLRVEVERALRQLHSVATTAIQQGITLEWETANAECDKLVQSVFGKRTVENPEFGAWLKRNGAARRAFIARSDAGMNLSDRVWQTTRQLRDEMEIAITCAVGDGTSAARLSRNVRKYLNDPDLMFRRFRYKDPETGEWRRKWKKRVIDPATGKVTFIDYDKDAYCDQWTGRGYYKSAAMNAMRVARTETNIAYRRADNARWQQMDFVIGQRVQMSRSHPRKDICDKLAGDYPKDFVFDGWHPQCFCFVTPINLEPDEIAEIMSHDDWESELKRVADSKRITDYPDNFKDWVSENAENIEAARVRGTEPYFVRNNAGIIDNILNPDATPANVPTQPHRLPENATDLIEHLRKHGDFNEHYDDELNERDIYRKWDSLSESERLQVLERGRYSGMLSTEDDLDFANLYQSMSKDRMINTLQDELENVRAGYDMEDSNHYIIKFKGDDKIIYSHDLEKPLTAAQIKKIEYISANGGMSNYGYWAANDDAKTKLMRELGFIEYRDGVVVESWNGKDFAGNPLHQISESGIDKAIKEMRKKLIRQDREQMIIFNSKGTVITQIGGDARSVTFDDSIAELLKNNWVSHNHPTGKNAEGVKRFGHSLSRDDVEEAVRCNMRSIIAEAPYYRYSIERPASGWPCSADEIKTHYEEIYNDVRREYRASFENHQNASILIQHIVMKRLSKLLGLNYKYIKL